MKNESHTRLENEDPNTSAGLSSVLREKLLLKREVTEPGGTVFVTEIKDTAGLGTGRSLNSTVTFIPLSQPVLHCCEKEAALKRRLQQWSVWPALFVKKYKVVLRREFEMLRKGEGGSKIEGAERAYQEEVKQLLLEFFNDETVQASFRELPGSQEPLEARSRELEQASTGPGWCLPPRRFPFQLKARNEATYESIEINKLNCTVLSTTFFERLRTERAKLVASNGKIKNCFDTDICGVVASTRLMKYFATYGCDGFNATAEEDFEKEAFYDEVAEDNHTLAANVLKELYSTEEKKELIFKLLKMVVLGGGLMQPEEAFEPYLDTVKQVYKDLVAVYKQDSGNIHICSHVYEVKTLDGDATTLFPDANCHNLCFAAIDVATWTLTFFAFNYTPYW